MWVFRLQKFKCSNVVVGKTNFFMKIIGISVKVIILYDLNIILSLPMIVVKIM